MATVGIITTFRQPNFGSVLQAYALQHVVDSLGYVAWIIDYKYPNDYHYDRGAFVRPKPYTWRHPFRVMLNAVLETFGLKTCPKMQMLNRFIKHSMRCTPKYLSHSSIHSTPPSFDIYLVGSDQIWNPHTMKGDMTYFFDFVPDGSHILSYASSFSCDSIPSQNVDEYKKYLSRFHSISVREANGCEVVKQLIGRNPHLVLDPTLLLDRNAWALLAKKSNRLKVPIKYILCYMLAYTYDPAEKMKELLKFMQGKYKLPIVSLSAIPYWDGGEFIMIENRQSVGVYEFLKLVENAEIVITSSFHGTAFALNFGKPFVAMQNGESDADDRISSLLRLVGLHSQLVKTDTVLNDNLSVYYDIDKEQQMLQTARGESLDFLINALKE